MDWPFIGNGTVDQAPTDVGPSADGTYDYPSSVYGPNQPVDAGGGAPGNYSDTILNIFKYGVGYLQQRDQIKAFQDYRQYQATPRGLYVAGQPGGGGVVAGFSSGTLLLIAAGLGLVLFLHHKG